MNAMGVVGSPRSKGNTATLVRKVLEGAAGKGAETNLFCLGGYRIGGCRACMACKRTGECVQDDDMKLLHAAIREANVLVLGAPIYFDQVSAQTKVFLDRLYSYLGPNLTNRFPKGITAVLVCTWGASDPGAYDDVITWIRGRLSGYFDVETVAVIKAADTGAHPVSGRDDLLQRAFEAGAGLAGRNR